MAIARRAHPINDAILLPSSFPLSPPPRFYPFVFSVFFHHPFFFPHPLVSLSSFFSFPPPFISLALPIPKHPGVNSRRIKFQEGRFRGEFMGLGYRSRFQPLARNRDWYLHPRIVPIPVSYSAPYACARFLRVLDTRAQPTTPLLAFVLHVRVRVL